MDKIKELLLCFVEFLIMVLGFVVFIVSAIVAFMALSVALFSFVKFRFTVVAISIIICIACCVLSKLSLKLMEKFMF